MSKWPISLKRPVPSLDYDLSRWCRELLAIHPFPFPDSLSELHLKIEERASWRCSFPRKADRIRVYIVDHRLFVPLVLTEQDGVLANACARFAKYEHRYADNLLGSGEMFVNYASDNGYDTDAVNSFIREYDISPVEVLSVPTLLVFSGKNLSEYRPIGTWQLCALLHQFHSENLVAWDRLSKAYFKEYL